MIILVQAVRWTHPRAAEMIIGHGRVFSGYTHISRVRLQKSSRSVSVFVSFLRPCQKCRGSRTPSSDPPDLHHQKSRSRADISPLSLIHMHTHPHADTTLLCVFSGTGSRCVNTGRTSVLDSPSCFFSFASGHLCCQRTGCPAWFSNTQFLQECIYLAISISFISAGISLVSCIWSQGKIRQKWGAVLFSVVLCVDAVP